MGVAVGNFTDLLQLSDDKTKEDYEKIRHDLLNLGIKASAAFIAYQRSPPTPPNITEEVLDKVNVYATI